MKFTNKNSQFQSKKSPFPTYMNSYVRDGKIEIGENSEYLEIDYLFCHTIDEIQEVEGIETTVQKEVVINRSSLRFTESHEPTLIKVGENEVEVYEAVLTGETYDKSKIISWGRPDLHKVMNLFEKSSLTDKDGLKIKYLDAVVIQGNVIALTPEQSIQINQITVDWLEENVIIENEKLSANFQIESTPAS